MRILFLDLDTLRPDHLGCYGYKRNTSPNIDRVASLGVRFNRYYCTDAPCLPSRSALLSGRYGIHNGAVNHGGKYAEQAFEGPDRGFQSTYSRTNLIRIFRDAGMKTVSVSPFAERHSSFWFTASFNETYNSVGKNGNESAEEVFPDALRWIERNAKDDNWLLHINFWDAHTPYRAPAEYGEPFVNEPLVDNWVTDDVIKAHNKLAGPHSSMEIGMFTDYVNPKFPRHLGKVTNMQEYKRLVDGYDTGIKYMDEHIGRLFDALEKQGVPLEDLAVIITSDHGENIGELNLYSEHATADDVTCRIPMIIKWPGCKAGHVDNDFHGNIDLCPTMAELLGTKRHNIWDGQSYAAVVETGERQGRDHIVLSQCAHVCQRSVRFGDWLYMRTYHDGFHPFPKEMLFNVADDPHETRDVFGQHPEVVQQAAYLYLNWYDEMMTTSPYEQDPLWAIMREGGPSHAKGHLKEYITRLNETGRQDQAEALIERHPGEMR